MSLLVHPIMHCPGPTRVDDHRLAEEVRWTDHLTVVSEGSLRRQLSPNDWALFYMIVKRTALTHEATRQTTAMNLRLQASPHETPCQTNWHQGSNVSIPSDMQNRRRLSDAMLKATCGNSNFRGGDLFHKWARHAFVLLTSHLQEAGC